MRTACSSDLSTCIVTALSSIECKKVHKKALFFFVRCCPFACKTDTLFVPTCLSSVRANLFSLFVCLFACCLCCLFSVLSLLISHAVLLSGLSRPLDDLAWKSLLGAVQPEAAFSHPAEEGTLLLLLQSGLGAWLKDTEVLSVRSGLGSG